MPPILLLAALLSPPGSGLEGLKAFLAAERPFTGVDEKADWYWRFDRIVIGRVVRINPAKTSGDAFIAEGEGSYELEPVRWLKGREGRLPRGKYRWIFTDDGKHDDSTPDIGQLQVYVERGRDRGWLPVGGVRCLPIPPAE